MGKCGGGLENFVGNMINFALFFNEFKISGFFFIVAMRLRGHGFLFGNCLKMLGILTNNGRS